MTAGCTAAVAEYSKFEGDYQSFVNLDRGPATSPVDDGSDEYHRQERRNVDLVGFTRGDETKNITDTGQSTCFTRREVRVVLSLVLAAFVFYVILDRSRIEETLATFLEWVGDHPLWGSFAIVLVYAVGTILFVPGSFLTFGCGFTFGLAFGIGRGVVLASICVFIGATVGSICAFLLGRYLFRECVKELTQVYPVFEAIDRALQTNGLKIMILLRLSPLIPYNALDYMSGVTSISLWSYSVAMVAVIPGVVTYCYLGATASGLAVGTSNIDNTFVRAISITLGVVFAVLGIAVASHYANQELNKILVSDEDRGMVESRTSPPDRANIALETVKV